MRYPCAPIASIAASFLLHTGVMSRNVVGTKPQSSGWCGSKISSSGGAIVLNALATPAPLASCRACTVASCATPWSGLNGSSAACVRISVRLELADQIGQPLDRGGVHDERVVAEVEAAEVRAERGGGRHRLAVADLLDALLGLAGLLPELARLAALAVGERDDVRRPAALDHRRDRARGAPDEVGGVRADDEQRLRHRPASSC